MERSLGRRVQKHKVPPPVRNANDSWLYYSVRRLGAIPMGQVQKLESTHAVHSLAEDDWFAPPACWATPTSGATMLNDCMAPGRHDVHTSSLYGVYFLFSETMGATSSRQQQCRRHRPPSGYYYCCCTATTCCTGTLLLYDTRV